MQLAWEMARASLAILGYFVAAMLFLCSCILILITIYLAVAIASELWEMYVYEHLQKLKQIIAVRKEIANGVRQHKKMVGK